MPLQSSEIFFTFRDSVDISEVMHSLHTLAPNRTETEGNRGRTKSEHSETPNYFALPIHRLFVTPLQSVGILPINFNRRRIWVGLRFPASAHSNRCVPDHSQEGKIKGQIPNNCGNSRDGFLCYHIILNSVAVLWHDVFLPSVKFLLSSRVEGISEKEHRTKPPAQTAPRSFFTFLTSHLPQRQNRVCKHHGKAALNVVLPQNTGNELSLLCAWLSIHVSDNAETSAMERTAKGCTGCPTVAAFTFLFYPSLH